MKILIAIDSFKGSLTSRQAGEAIAQGFRRVLSEKEAQIEVHSLADGGEGTTAALVEALQGEWRSAQVMGPLLTPVTAHYGVIPQRKLAIIEMAEAAGLALVPPDKRNPLLTSTYGFGELIRHAIEKEHCQQLILCIGGSATNDGGIGMLQALGFQFLDSQGKMVSPNCQGLASLALIDDQKALSSIKDGSLSIQVACDVNNPLCGPQGCSAIFSPQKGATPDIIPQMDQYLAHFAELTKQLYPDTNPNLPGSGAAGGLGFAIRSYLHGSLKSGIQIVLQESHMEEAIERADFVVTGEGRLDAQTMMGKAPAGIASLAKKKGKPVIAFSGCATRDANLCNESGIDAFFPVLRTPCSLQDAMATENAALNCADTAEQVMRLYLLRHSC